MGYGASCCQFDHRWGHAPIQAKKIDGLQFRFKSTKSLKMTDYGMAPPRPMLGLIKVKDQIVLDLDLTVSVLEKM